MECPLTLTSSFRKYFPARSHPKFGLEKGHSARYPQTIREANLHELLRIPSGNRIYPGPTHSGYFSWSSKNHQGQQPNVATTVAKARLNETDIYMSRYELSVKTYLADRYKNSNTNLQISEVLPRQDNRSVLDENIDHSRKLRLAVSPVVESAPHEGKPVPEQTLMKSIYNRMPAGIGSVGRMSAEAKYMRRGSQMPARIEYVDKSYQIYAEPSALHNASYMNNQQGI